MLNNSTNLHFTKIRFLYWAYFASKPSLVCLLHYQLYFYTVFYLKYVTKKKNSTKNKI